MKFLIEEILNCTSCHLRQHARRPVPGTGNHNSKVMLVGEAPGDMEDLKGEHFVGDAGQLLTRALKRLQVQRRTIYITNAVKCRPRNNRTPGKEELQACFKWLEKEILILSPSVIVTLGKTATNALFPDNDWKITRVRGTIQYYNNIPVVITYHPAFLLRNRDVIYKKQFLMDLQKAFKLVEILQTATLQAVLKDFKGQIVNLNFYRG